MTTPRMAILTTCYGDANTLRRSVKASLQQTEPSVEVVIVDNGARDHTAPVAASLARMDARVRVLTFERNQVQPVALNAALRASSAPWAMIVNADDYLAPDAVATILAVAERDPSVNCVFSPWQWFGARSDTYDFAPYTGDIRMVTEHQVPGIRAFRRDLWDALGGEDEGIAIGADWDWAVRGAARGLLVPYKVDRPLWHVCDQGPHVRRLSAQCNHVVLREHMRRHFETADVEC